MRAALDAVPPFGVSAETPADVRPAVDAKALSAPPAPGAGTPAFIVIGQPDLFVGETLRYARTLIRSGVQTELHVCPGAYHAFMSFAQGADVSRRASADLRDAMVRHFRGGEPAARKGQR